MAVIYCNVHTSKVPLNEETSNSLKLFTKLTIKCIFLMNFVPKNHDKTLKAGLQFWNIARCTFSHLYEYTVFVYLKGLLY